MKFVNLLLLIWTIYLKNLVSKRPEWNISSIRKEHFPTLSSKHNMGGLFSGILLIPAAETHRLAESRLCMVWIPKLGNTTTTCESTERVRTCYDLPEFGVQVDSAGQKHLHVSGIKNRRPGGEEHLKATDVSIDLQQRLNILCGGDIFGDPSKQNTNICF